MYSKGLHLLMTLKTNSTSAITNCASFLDFAVRVLEKHDTEIVGVTHHVFENDGFTAAICLKESHLCIHTWPEFDQLTFDLYLCNYASDNTEKVEQISKEMVAFFQADIIQEDRILR